jgi:hypothetical protein
MVDNLRPAGAGTSSPSGQARATSQFRLSGEIWAYILAICLFVISIEGTIVQLLPDGWICALLPKGWSSAPWKLLLLSFSVWGLGCFSNAEP